MGIRLLEEAGNVLPVAAFGLVLLDHLKISLWPGGHPL